MIVLSRSSAGLLICNAGGGFGIGVAQSAVGAAEEPSLLLVFGDVLYDTPAPGKKLPPPLPLEGTLGSYMLLV